MPMSHKGKALELPGGVRLHFRTGHRETAAEAFVRAKWKFIALLPGLERSFSQESPANRNSSNCWKNQLLPLPSLLFARFPWSPAALGLGGCAFGGQEV